MTEVRFDMKLKFTPLEFETKLHFFINTLQYLVKIYSVGV